MRVTLSNARAMADALTRAAASAQEAGAMDFDVLDALSLVDDDARAQLTAAIAEAAKSGGS
jgi:hypothetical protein